MPAGYIICDAREFAYGRLIKQRDEFIKKTGVNDIRFTDDKRQARRISTGLERLERLRLCVPHWTS